jgi:hypothetical protein
VVPALVNSGRASRQNKQLSDRFLHKLVGSPPRPRGHLVKLRFLILRQMYFHAQE